jgi:hypothetical protein
MSYTTLERTLNVLRLTISDHRSSDLAFRVMISHGRCEGGYQPLAREDSVLLDALVHVGYALNFTVQEAKKLTYRCPRFVTL